MPAFGQSSIVLMANNVGFISPINAYTIDIKMDDGNPTSGIVVTIDSAMTLNCLVTQPGGTAINPSAFNSTAAAYSLTVGVMGCTRMYFYF
jgi:hypothetical protein